MSIEQLLPVNMKKGGICLSVSHKKHLSHTNRKIDVGFQTTCISTVNDQKGFKVMDTSVV